MEVSPRTDDPAVDELARAFEAHRGFLFGLCYRMTGDAALAEDLVQDTFRRALERPPRDTARPWRPWLSRVASRLCLDALRRRRRRAYTGTWLPSPIEGGGDDLPPTPHARYDALESVTMAFLVALEALTPRQRAVLLLRDVVGHDGRQTAELLSMTEVNVKVTLHRARRAMRAYDAERVPDPATLPERTVAALQRLISAFGADDDSMIEATLRQDVRALNDGAGEFFAAGKPVLGRERVTRFYRGVRRDDPDARLSIRTINGLPALVAVYPNATGKLAPRAVFTIALGPDGRVRELHTVIASDKLRAIAFD